MAASMPQIPHRLKRMKSLVKSLLFHSKCSETFTYQKRWLTYKSFTVDTGGEERITFEVGKVAKFADGSVIATLGDTSVLVAVTSKTESSNAGFLPLTVDYRQKAAAAGRIPTNHLRRELGPTDKEILTSRVIDRSLRSTFPADYFCETLVTCNLLSVDGVNDPDVLSINAASASLYTSDIPWNGPVGAVRVGQDNNNSFIINPTRKQQQHCDMNVIVTTDQNRNVLMLEGESGMVDYDQFYNGIEIGASHAANIARNIAESHVAEKKRFWKPDDVIDGEMIEDVERIGAARINEILFDRSHDKISRDTALQKCRYSIVIALYQKYGEDKKLLLHDAVSIIIKKLFRNQILYDSARCDGRSLTHVRHITSAVDLYKPLHGSALFTRGQTQVLGTVTFDSLQATMKADPMSVLTGAIKEKNFMLNYEFPPYATNEIRSPGIKNRRELGHGSLAEKGLRPIIPNNFPFSIRLNAEVLESNGSSSMASICAGTLALMDAGVEIKAPAAGVAIGLIADDNKYAIMTDILGIEDYMGDMDLKIGGTQEGITAIQMDLKIPGIPLHVVKLAIDRAKEGIQFVLYIMAKTSKMTAPRPTLKSNGPVTERITVLPAKRGSFVGVGGINLKKLQSEAGVTVTTVDESTFEIFAPNSEAMKEAKEMMTTWMEVRKEPDLEFNAIYEAKIVEIRNNGLMVQIHPAMNPILLQNSQLDHRQVAHPSVLGFKEGEIISIKYFGRDPTTGKHRISRKVLTAVASKTFRFLKEPDNTDVSQDKDFEQQNISSNVPSSDSYADTKVEVKTPTQILYELAAQQKVEITFGVSSLMYDSDNTQTISVKLEVGDEVYTATGLTAKSAKHDAASMAIEKSKYFKTNSSVKS